MDIEWPHRTSHVQNALENVANILVLRLEVFDGERSSVLRMVFDGLLLTPQGMISSKSTFPALRWTTFCQIQDVVFNSISKC